MQTTACKKFSALLLLLALLLSLLTGCTADPTGSSSAPSSDVPPSSDPGSSDVPDSSVPESSDPTVPPSSSSPEYPAVQLTGPAGMPAMTNTLTEFGYIDKNGVLHYSPVYKKAHGNAVTTKYSKYIAADGTAGVKSLAEDGYTGLYILMQNGTIRLTKTTGMDNKAEMTAQNYTKVGALQSWGGGDAAGLPNTIAALTYGTDNTAALLTHKNFDFGCKTTGIVQVIGADGYLPVFLYQDGTVGLFASSTPYAETSRAQVAQWKDIVQIAVCGNTLMGLQKDGVLKSTYTGDSPFGSMTIPVAFRTHIARIFQTDYAVCIQRSDGAIYSSSHGELGKFARMDQIYCFGSYSGTDVLVGVDTTGKVHCLSHKVEDLPKDSAAAWACTLTDVKTVWND